MTKALEILFKEMEAKGSEYVAAYNAGGKKKSELTALKKAATAACDRYNQEFSKETYRIWAREGDPVKTAIRNPSIKGAKKLRFRTDDDNVMTLLTDTVEYDVNLPMMQATIGSAVFHDPRWFRKAGTLAKIVANTVNEHLGGSAIFRYGDGELDDFSFDGIDPHTDEGVILALQQVFDAIIFLDDGNGDNIIKADIKVDSNGKKYASAWAYIREAMTKKTGRGVIDVCNDGGFSDLVLDAMHIVLTRGDFVLTTSERDKTLDEKPIVVNLGETIRKTEDEALAD